MVEIPDLDNVLNKVLKTLISDEEIEDVKEGISVQVDEGSKLYSIIDNEVVGFALMTPIDEEGLSEGKIEVINIDEIFISSNFKNENIGEFIGREFKKIAKSYGKAKVEVVVSKELEWLGKELDKVGYVCNEVQAEKIIYFANNLSDVLELIKDCTPEDRIMQVLLEQNDEFQTEFVESIEEVSDLIDEGWKPVLVSVTFEPNEESIQDVLERSNQLIKWDDYSIIYRS